MDYTLYTYIKHTLNQKNIEQSHCVQYQVEYSAELSKQIKYIGCDSRKSRKPVHTKHKYIGRYFIVHQVIKKQRHANSHFKSTLDILK